MEKLTNNIAKTVSAELNLDNDSKEVIAYGLFAILHTILCIFLILFLVLFLV